MAARFNTYSRRSGWKSRKVDQRRSIFSHIRRDYGKIFSIIILFRAEGFIAVTPYIGILTSRGFRCRRVVQNRSCVCICFICAVYGNT